jgi:hypothetical protein
VEWQSLVYVAEDKDQTLKRFANLLREFRSINDLMEAQQLFWFFQLRDCFMSQSTMTKWSATHLDGYVVFPVHYGFINNTDCFFISHYWRTPLHPDPQGEDLCQFREDLKDQPWSYVWLDWTCMPQVPRSSSEERYFRQMLRCIPIVVQDCAFEWRFPQFEPRAWILFEVAVWMLNHNGLLSLTHDVKPFAYHVNEMVNNGVKPTLEYRCTNNSDLALVTGWLEILVIFYKVVPNVQIRQETMDKVFHSSVGSYKNIDLMLEINKSTGTIVHQGFTYRFTPIFSLTSNQLS